MKGQISLSSVGMELKGIDSINCTSLGKNKFRKTSECQLLEPVSIDEATNIFSIPCVFGVEI